MKRKKNGEHRESQVTVTYIFGFTFNLKSKILLENML